MIFSGQIDMKKTLFTITISFILVVILCFSVMNRQATDSDTSALKKEIKIGVIAPLTGTHRVGGESILKGARLAVDTINDKGGISGAKLMLITKNDENDPDLAEKSAKSLILEDQVNVIIGSYSSKCCLKIKEVVNKYKTPLIVPVAMADNIITGKDYVFRNTLPIKKSQNKIKEIATMKKNEYALLDGFNAKTMGILWQRDSWGFQMQKRVVTDLTALSREDSILFNEPFQLGTMDFTEYFKDKTAFPDVIYVISSGDEAISIVSDGRDSGYKGLFYGEGGFNYAQFDQQLKQKAEGCIFTSEWHPSFSTPMSDIFVQLYSKKYNSTPDMFSATSYEAIYILHNSLRHIMHAYGKPDFNQLLQKDLSIPKNMDGLTGTISFDKNGQCDRSLFMLQKRWDGNQIQAFIIYPSKYAQGDIQWNFDKKTSPQI